MSGGDQGPHFNGGWSLRVSGSQTKRDVTDSLGSSLRAALETPGYGLKKFSIDQEKDGWVAWANGYSEDPAHAGAIVSAVNTVLAAGDYQPGSSEFTSPFGSQVNFHPVAESQAATGQAAAADAFGRG